MSFRAAAATHHYSPRAVILLAAILAAIIAALAVTVAATTAPAQPKLIGHTLGDNTPNVYYHS
jgi:hypothetical protein